jgi:tRNA-(ms[2]io[6]A)-hydroxylase
MLSLASATDSRWLSRALADLDEILIDHAHCEKKAASTAVSLLFRYPERIDLAVPLARLAREELVHFEQVLALLQARGVAFRHLRPSPYASGLRSVVRAHEPDRLLDTLLCLALIEARSCERMQLVADAVPDARVAALYRELLASEARHHRLYVDLAELGAPPDVVRDRLAVLALHEAAVLRAAPPWPRMHA